MVTRESLEFQYNPDEIADEKSADFATIKVPGMSHPRYQYVSGGARCIVFKLTFFKGASLADPSGLFNSSLEGKVRRAIDIREGDSVDEEALKALIRAAVVLNMS
jgi:hypothetical protein